VALTNKQRIFVAEYTKDFNATRAAIAAGYSEVSAHNIGWQNVRKGEIADEIEKVVNARCMTKEEVLHRLGEQGRADVKDFLSTQADGTPFFDYQGALDQGKTHLIKKMKTKRRIYTEKGKEDTPIVETEVEFELHDSQNALVQIGRHHKLFTDKSELSGPDGGPIAFTADDMAQAKNEIEQWKQQKNEQKLNG
jgi:phage terminase small subunit